jgi:hypothetical protein
MKVKKRKFYFIKNINLLFIGIKIFIGFIEIIIFI